MGDDDFVEAFQSLADGPPARVCSVGWTLDQMSPELREAVGGAFMRPGVTVGAIHGLLERAGYKVSYSAMTRHARRMRNEGSDGCRCPRT